MPNPIDIKIQSRLEALKINKNKFNSNFRPPSALNPTRATATFPPPPTNFSTRPRLTPTAPPLSWPQNFFQPVTPSAPPLSPPPPNSFLIRTTNANATRATRFDEAVSGKCEQELVRRIDDVLEDVPSPLTLELADEILNVLDDTENVLQNDYLSKKDTKQKRY